MRLLGTALLLGLLASSGVSDEPKEKSTLSKLKGEWRVAYATDGGPKVAPPKSDEARLAIGDDGVKWANLPYLGQGGGSVKVLMAANDSGTAEFPLGGKIHKMFFSVTKPSREGKEAGGDEPETLQLAIGAAGGPAPKAMPKKDDEKLPEDIKYFYRFTRAKPAK